MTQEAQQEDKPKTNPVIQKALKEFLNICIQENGIQNGDVSHIGYDVRIMSHNNERIGREVGMVLINPMGMIAKD